MKTHNRLSVAVALCAALVGSACRADGVSSDMRFEAAAEKNAPYFCGVNFARQIRIPIGFAVGYADVTCPPNAVYSAYNVCPSAEKTIVGGVGMGHGVNAFCHRGIEAWEKLFSKE